MLKDKDKRKVYAAKRVSGLEEEYSIFAGGHPQDLQAFISRYKNRYQPILDEFEAMVRENEHIKQQVN